MERDGGWREAVFGCPKIWGVQRPHVYDFSQSYLALQMTRTVYDHERIARWVAARTGGTYDGLGTSIGLEKGGELIAGVVYDGYNGRSICMHVASNGEKQWLSRGFLRECFEYPFLRLKVKRIIGLVDSTNLAAIRFDMALGFKLETEIPDAGPVANLCILSMSPSRCRWLHLKERHGKQIESTC